MTTSGNFLTNGQKLPSRFQSTQGVEEQGALISGFKMPKQFAMCNENFIKFKFFEILNIKTVPWDNGRGHVEHVPKCDDILIKRINAQVSN